jgi:MFS family permease
MPITTATVPPSQRPSRLLTHDLMPVVVGAVALVTLGALENRAVGTVLPTLLGDLHALSGFAAVSAAPLASYLVALAAGGWWCDRSGPAPALRAGAALFSLAQVLVGTAGSLGVVVAGRLVSGLAEGLLDVAVMVLVARALDPALRPRVMALFAGAWILPSVLGPVLTGLVTETLGWRWVFLGAVLVLVPVWLVLRPALRRPLEPSDAVDTAAQPAGEAPRLRAVLPWAALAAAALVTLSLASEHLTTPVVAAVVAAVAALALAARRLLPPGTFRAACGVGGVVAVRAAVSAAFMGIGGFLPLLMVQLRHVGPTAAGVSLSVTGVMWSVGSALQSRWSAHPAALLRGGLTALAVGLAGTALLAWPAVPLLAGLAAWALAGVGIGMTTSTLSVLTMAVSDDRTQGRNNAGAQMAAGMSSAVFFALAGAVLALVGQPDARAFALIAALAAALAALALAGSRRALCAASR